VPRRANLIRELGADLRPAPLLRKPRHLALLWGAGAWLFVVGATIAVQPLRPGVLDQLLASPRFAGETLFGLLAGGLAIWVAFGLLAGGLAIWVAFAVGTPGRSQRRWIALALGGLAIWASAYLYGLVSPALEPSMLGKRQICFLEVLLYGLPSLAVGLLLLRRLAPLERWSAGLLMGAAAGAMPGLLMQLGCMYVPAHILSHHLGPVVGLALLGALGGPLVLRRI
jgi:hypothetical protein